MITESEKKHRASKIAITNASSYLEGIEPDDEMKKLQQQYIQGEFKDAKEMGNKMRAHLRTKKSR